MPLRALIDLGIVSELGRPMPSNRHFQIVRGGLKKSKNNSCIPTNLVGYQIISIQWTLNHQLKESHENNEIDNRIDVLGRVLRECGMGRIQDRVACRKRAQSVCAHVYVGCDFGRAASCAGRLRECRWLLCSRAQTAWPTYTYGENGHHPIFSSPTVSRS
jgi:hypothetical protein